MQTAPLTRSGRAGTAEQLDEGPADAAAELGERPAQLFGMPVRVARPVLDRLLAVQVLHLGQSGQGLDQARRRPLEDPVGELVAVIFAQLRPGLGPALTGEYKPKASVATAGSCVCGDGCRSTCD